MRILSEMPPKFGWFFYGLNMSELCDLIKSRKKVAEDYLATKRSKWSEYEDLFNGTLADQMSEKAKSQVFDHKLSTQVLEREARVMAQLATGKVKAISKNDEGASKLMNLLLDKYMIPNANSQFDFLTKLRLVDRYSNIYGNYFAMVDWDIRKDGYMGPDLFLVDIRDVFPQVGAVSLEDSDFCIVRSWRPLSWFESLGKDKEFKNVSKVINLLKDKSGDKSAKSTLAKSNRDQQEYPSGQEAKGKGYYEVLSMYEKDRWVDYVTGADMEIRDIANPHENGELPLVNKYSIPMVDDFMGIGDFERGKTMQYAINGLWNLYFDACKISIFPPVLINKDGIADVSSIKWSAAAKWLMKGNLGNAAQVLNLTPQGINTFNNSYNLANAALMNMFGTTDTAVSKDTDQSFGKTPQALEMQAKRENSRDNVDRFYMEQFVSKVMKKFVNLMSKKQSGNVAIRMFSEEIDEMSKQYPDVQEMYNEKSGKLTIGKGKVGSVLYDYEIVPGSTYALDQKAQQESLIQMLAHLSQGMQMQEAGGVTSPLIESIRAKGKDVDVGELFTRIVSNAGIQDWSKIVYELKDRPEEVLDRDANKFMVAMQQMGGVGGVPAPTGNPEMDQMMEPQDPMQMGQMNPMGQQYGPSIETNQPF